MATDGPGPSEYWYEEVTGGPLRQGDIIRDLSVPWFPEDLDPDSAPPDSVVQFTARVTKGDWIVLDASCDLDQHRCTQILVAPVKSATQQMLGVVNKEKEYKERLEVLRRGLAEARYLLPEHVGAQPPFALSFVEFRQHLLVPIEHLERNANARPRLRLRSPFREQFGTWAGGCLARIGPEDHTLIPPFLPKLFDAQKLRAVEGMPPIAQATSRLASRPGSFVKLVRWVRGLFSG